MSQLAAEKEKLKAERDEEFRQKELENDLRNAEHIKTVSAVKAELSAKVRQVKVRCFVKTSCAIALEQ